MRYGYFQRVLCLFRMSIVIVGRSFVYEHFSYLFRAFFSVVDTTHRYRISGFVTRLDVIKDMVLFAYQLVGIDSFGDNHQCNDVHVTY